MPVETALVVPVLDERASVAATAALLRDCLDRGVVDRAVVVDGGSTDGTREALAAAGVEVLAAAALGTDEVHGKGDSLWRAVHHVEAARYVFVDGDLDGMAAASVAALAAALDRPGTHLAKASFDRVQHEPGADRRLGGRVTELLARPLLHRFAPDLDHVRVPLSGQQAVRGDTVRSLPLCSGYGFEVGLLLAVRARHGATAVVDVPIAPIGHDAKDDASLVPMAHQVLAAAAWGLGLDGPALDPAAEPGAGVRILPPVAAGVAT